MFYYVSNDSPNCKLGHLFAAFKLNTSNRVQVLRVLGGLRVEYSTHFAGFPSTAAGGGGRAQTGDEIYAARIANNRN